jgi:trans-aconitate 2-methyltransferase
VRTSHTGPREWNAAVYDRVSQPQLEWSAGVLARLSLAGDETVLDAGCGSGRVTELLLDRLPRGRVIGVDASQDMVAHARRRLSERSRFLVADLAELELDEQVDAVFSNAVFHWVPNHEALFARLFAVLRPGGVLVAQCGGAGNVASLAAVLVDVVAREPFAGHFGSFGGIWNFATPHDTARRLRAAGFEAVRCWLEPKWVRPDTPREYLETVTLGPHLAHLPEELREPFVDAVAQQMGEPLVLDYVRLNIDARRPA